jgi:hypothetical protein
MIFFKRIFAVFLSGVLVQPVISMEKSRHESKRHEILQHPEDTPHVSFHVVKSMDQVEPIDGLTQESPVVTGAVKREGDVWSLALWRTYARRDTLMGTLEENGLGVLWEALERYAGADEEKSKGWQVLYLVRKDDTSGATKWLVEGIGFIKGAWASTPQSEIRIPYIVTGQPEHARSCIEHLERQSENIKFEEVDVNEHQHEVARKAASMYYPRFLCMADINTCFAGHAGLCRFAWGTTLDPKSGYPDNNVPYYGFTILEGGLNTNTGSLQRLTTLKMSHRSQYDQVVLKLRELGFKIDLADE